MEKENINGLTSDEVEALLKQYGLNVIEEQKSKPLILKFFEQFNNFLTLLLISAALISLFIGEIVDGLLILAIVVLNASFGLYQELKAEESIAALKKMTSVKIRVIRDGREQEIDSKFLVPGDVIFIEEGVKIPADGRILEARNLELNEAALTGESLPVSKDKGDGIFGGTIVNRGRAFAQVTATGMETKFGQIAKKLITIDEPKTPLQIKLEELTRLIGIVGIIVSAVVLILSLIDGASYFSSFLLAVSLAVAVVPEGLPAVMTITLAIGIKEMAKHKAIVRKLSTIEALGSISIIATDKTGTITANKMKVKEIWVDAGKKMLEERDLKFEKEIIARSLHYQISDQQYQGQNSRSARSLYLMLLNGILCSTASLVFVYDHRSYDVLGDPTEGALLYLGQEFGFSPQLIRDEWLVIDEMPFDSVTKRMSVLVSQKTKNKNQRDSQRYVFSKGAPESILEICNWILVAGKKEPLTTEEIQQIEKKVEDWAGRGLRVLAFAYKEAEKSKRQKSNIQSLISEMTFLGMVAIHDPPRPEVAQALKKAKEAGVKVVMITGDNEVTAEAIGVSTGFIKEGDEIVTGRQLDEYSDGELLKKLPKVKIFARTTPFHKARIVKLYQQLGEIVAVTGDGVNDAIALKQADVGVAMGLVGTDVARETADMVITDDNFATIVNAVEEGRNIIKHLQNAIKYLLSCNMAEAVSLVVGLALGLRNLFYPIQLLYINLVTDGLPALALSFSPKAQQVMRQPPQKKLTLLDHFDKVFIFFVGVIAAGIVLVTYFSFGEAEILKRTAAFCVLALVQSFIFLDLWLSHRSIRKHIKMVATPVFYLAFLLPIVMQYLIVTIPLLVRSLKVAMLTGKEYLILVFISSIILLGIRFLFKIKGLKNRLEN